MKVEYEYDDVKFVSIEYAVELPLMPCCCVFAAAAMYRVPSFNASLFLGL